MEKNLKLELGFVQRRLPWLIAAGAFVVYLVTLNHSATFSGLVNLAKVVGWDWRPVISTPLQTIVTLPVRFLPASVQLTALNVIAALCASAALGLLARCVALLPHDRTRDQRQAERSEHSLFSGKWAWAPPILAAAVCGFQLSFWENAVVGTGEALDLLVFAWLVQTLLMFRLDQKESRLSWFALVYGLGVVNNYALIGFLPLFLGAIVWIRGMAFFNLRFLLRMFIMGIVGLLLYLPLPLIAVMTSETGYSLWEMLITNWSAQRESLLGFPRVIALLLSFTSILPVIFMGIRWPAQFGEVSQLGNALTNAMTHLIHAVFLIACTYVAFDQFFSPRNLAGSIAPFLPFYFLGALTIGYCAGYFLLLCGTDSPRIPQWQKPSALRRLANQVIVIVVLAGVAVVPTLLAIQNLPEIWANTGSALSRLSALSAKSLPKDGAVVLSDEPFRLYALENELRQSGGRDKYILVDTRSLESGGYHLHMLRKHPNQWPTLSDKLKPKDEIPQPALVQLMLSLSKSHPIYYLHPSFGYYFEYFEMRPKGLTYELRPYSNDTLAGPPLTDQEIAEGEQFWAEVKTEELDRIAPKIPAADFPLPGAKVKVRPVTLEMYVGRSYSQALNVFGVAVQRAGKLEKAAGYYDLALKLDPYNASAMLNGEYNRKYRAGDPESGPPSEAVMKRMGSAGGSWDAVLSTYGPIEEPHVALLAAQAFNAGSNPRQAAAYVERVVYYNPGNVDAAVKLAALAVRAMLPDLALEKIRQVRSGPHAGKLTPAQRMELGIAEAWAHASKQDLQSATRILREEQSRNPGESEPWSNLFNIYLGAGQMTNAMAVVEEQLKVQPRNVQALVNGAVMRGRMNQPKEALELLNRALEINPKDEFALLNRAMLHSVSGSLDLAQKDFETLHAGQGSSALQVTLGLADVYFRQKNNREALRLYRQLLKTLPKQSAEYRLATERAALLD